MNAPELRSHKSKDLAQMARQAGVMGWHAMRKEELITALVSQKRHPPKATKAPPSAKPPAPTPLSRKKDAASRKLAALQKQRQRMHDLSTEGTVGNGSANAPLENDRLVLLVRDPYWLHACWELRGASIERARTSLGQQWHTAKPVLRIHRVNEKGSILSTKQVVIHGGVSNWYIDVVDPPARYRGEIGYAAPDGTFYCIARGNEVVTPAHSSDGMGDENWTDVARNADRIYAMSGGYSPGGASLELQELLEQRLRRRLGRPSETRFSPTSQTEDQLRFSLDAELVVYGSAHPNAHVTVQGEPIQLHEDGGFVVKLPLPDRRQVIPVVAGSPDGIEQKTIILGVERNTKVLKDTRREVPHR